MIWTSALWFMFAVLAFSTSANVSDEWPYTIKDHAGQKYQSPVDINTTYAVARDLSILHYSGYWKFNRSRVEISNNGHTVYVKIANNSEKVPYITGGPLFDNKYEFEQMHFHWGNNDNGSEHKVNGHKYAMEVHMVHYKKEYGNVLNASNHSDGVCVVGFFGEISSDDNEDMDNFITDLKYLVQPNSKINRSFKEEFSWIKETAKKQRYYAYPGSLTTPPFSECVIWVIFTVPIEISRKQLMAFRKLRSSDHGVLINENDRDLQPFNNRTIIYGYY